MQWCNCPPFSHSHPCVAPGPGATHSRPAGQPKSQPAGCGQVLAGSMFFNEAGALIAT